MICILRNFEKVITLRAQNFSRLLFFRFTSRAAWRKSSRDCLRSPITPVMAGERGREGGREGGKGEGGREGGREGGKGEGGREGRKKGRSERGRREGGESEKRRDERGKYGWMNGRGNEKREGEKGEGESDRLVRRDFECGVPAER